MPCKCSKKRKSKYMQRRLFEIEQFKIFRNMRSKLPKSLSRQILLDYHRKTHMLYEGNIKRKPINKEFVNSIVDLHDKFVKEMLQRGISHKTPLKRV